MGARVLVTGCNGFVGRHLCTNLRDAGLSIVGLGIEEKPWAPWINYLNGDLSDPDTLRQRAGDEDYRQIYHLAAVANPRAAAENPGDAIRSNVIGSLNLYEFVRAHPSTRLLVVGSSEVYSSRWSVRPRRDERSPVEPRSVYGASKLAAEVVGRRYAREYGLSICFTRSFNHTGPGQAPAYVLSDFARQCARIAAGKSAPVISVGNLRVRRDFTDVRDVVRAYVLVAAEGTPGEVYNVCSGKSYRLDALLGFLVSLTGRNVTIVFSGERVRRGEPPRIAGSNRKLRRQFGWSAVIPIERTLRDLYAYWTRSESSNGENQ